MSTEQEEYDDNYCKICFEPYTKSHFNCGHIIHIDCQIKSGSNRCCQCTQPIRLTRWMDVMIMKWKQTWVNTVPEEREPEGFEDDE